MQFEPRSAAPHFDVITIGAGFAGLHMLHTARSMGLSVRVYEAADDVGGVWYWNRYPGARCDVESLQYSYSFDNDLEQEWVWTERYAAQPEILRYIEHVAHRFDLRRDICFRSRVKQASYSESRQRWEVETESGDRATCRYLVMATGALSMPRLPDIPGMESFEGRIYHTGAWPHESVDFTGSRVGVIGTGSSGIQAIPQIARQAERLVVFQRTANYSVPAKNAPLEPEAERAFKAKYREYRALAREVGTVYEFSDKSAREVSDADRLREYERRWQRGGVNIVHAYNDLMRDKASNDTIAEFVRSKIREIVKDPETADSLTPKDHPLGTKRVCVDIGYYETFNRDNVALVDLKKTPITHVGPTGVQVGESWHELDALVCATGYDALTGALLAIDVRGRGGLQLRRKWADGPRTYLGLMTAGFPNLFVITGPGSPSVLVNVIVGIEHHVEWIAECIGWLRRHGHTTIEATRDAEDRWVQHVNAAAERTLYPMANSWFLGANIPGKPRVFMPYVAKIGVYRRECQEIADAGYVGFDIRPAQPGDSR
ncbi:flavin-containing monooxygenase [Ramlibacter sp.]|uniref:flavin-containing monooxygenase n=1 Tax=Ramlibacter sp. TaxID=1917967 RepID=UPI003D14EA84